MGLRKVTDPALLELLNAADEPTLPERKGEADIVQSGASAENAQATAAETKALLPAKVTKGEAEATKATLEAAEAQDKADKRQDASASAISALRGVIDKIDTIALDSADNNGWFETGTTGSLMRKLGPDGTPAADLQKNLHTIDANTAFAALQAMRDNSPTGGALGSITEKELDLLRSTVSNLDPNQSQPQFLGNLAATKKHYLDMLRRLDPAAAEEYQSKAGIRIDKDGAMILTPINGPDERQRIDPFGLIGPGGYGPDAGGSGTMPGGPGGPAPDGGAGGTPPVPVGDDYSLGGLAKGLKQGVGSIVEGAAALPALAIDPWYKPMLESLGYKYPQGGAAEGLRKALGLPDNTSEAADTLIKGGTAALTGSLGAKGVGAALSPGAAKEALAVVGAQPVRDTVAGVAAGGGGELAREMGGGPMAQTAAAIGAGMLGYGGANAVTSLMQPKTPSQIAQLAAKYDVNLHPADAGGLATKRIANAAKHSPLSGKPVVDAAQRTQADLGRAAGKLARDQITQDIPTTDVAGDFLRDAAKRYSASSKDLGDTNYKRVWRDPAASSLTIPPRNGLASIDALITDLRAAPNTNAPAIENLLKLRRDIAGGMTAKNIHALRSEIRDGIYDGGLRSSRDQARMKQIGQALSDDMFGYLDKSGMGRTSNAIRKADAYWQQRVEHIDEVLQPIIGKGEAIGGEQIVSRIEGMARGKSGGGKRLNRLMSNMAEPERQQVRATVIDRLGRVAEGAEGDDAFSAIRFVENWDKMTPQGKSALFQDAGLRKSIDEIAALAKGTQSSGKLAKYDPSNMPSVISNVGLQTGLLMAHPASAVIGTLAQIGTGRLLASPKFAKWLAGARDATNERTFIEQLGTIGTREPLLRSDIAGLQQRLSQSLTQSPAPRVAAEEEDQQVRREPVEAR